MSVSKRRAQKAKFKREDGEFFTPLMSHYTAAQRFVFEHAVSRLVDDNALKVVAMDIFKEGFDGRRLDADEAITLIADALAYTRSDLSQREARMLVGRCVAALLRTGEETALPPVTGATARQSTRFARKAQVRALRGFRR